MEGKIIVTEMNQQSVLMEYLKTTFINRTYTKRTIKIVVNFARSNEITLILGY